MTVGNPKIKVTRTDVARFINEQHEQFPELSARWEVYMSSRGRARRDGSCQFGFWLRTKFPKDFNKIFVWAKKHHCEVLDEVYKNPDSE